MIFSNNIREIILDTETTGLSYANGDKIVDIACLELINHVPTGKIYQTYINPQRKMHADAVAISGITDKFLKDKPLFAEIVDDFLAFVGDAKFVIHNAKFDIGFINSELSTSNKPGFKLEDAIDTLDMARKKFPGSPANLDALCRRFNVDTSSRKKHGALVDCYLLAEVYINLIGGKQRGLTFVSTEKNIETSFSKRKTNYDRRTFPLTSEEREAHKEFVESIKNSLWKK